MNAEQHLRQTFGFDQLKPGQGEVVEALLAGRSALAVFPTGGGKSLCYQLPALMLGGLTLVVSPLIALMKDQIGFLTRHGVPAARLDSSLDREETQAVWQDLRSGVLRILYIAPERFQNERFMARLRGTRIALMAIDEAHCISEWGHNFRPDYLKLAGVAKELGAERVLALTATATPAVATSIRKAFQIREEDHVHTGFHRPNLFLRMTPMAADARDGHLLQRLAHHPDGPTIVYVTLQHTAERVAKLLVSHGFSAEAYHAGMKPDLRSEVQDRFMEGSSIVVATIAFGMGIDKADIRYVYHYNLPKALENYAQEIGRAGRDGLPGICELFAARQDMITLQNFSYGDTPTPEAVTSFLAEILELGRQSREFHVSRYQLSSKHDIRQLVVSTLLTYLELEGVIESTAPFYDTYKFKPARSSAEILERHPERAAFLRRVLARSKKARTWFSIDITATAQSLDTTRRQVVEALEFLSEQGDLELQVSGIRHGYRLLVEPSADLSQRLSERFHAAEQRDIARIAGVLELASQATCLVQSLLGYFGEDLGPCGHCDRCKNEVIPQLPPAVDEPFAPEVHEGLRKLRAEGHPALGSTRQQARFLCGLPSPAVGRARLRGHPLWGRLSKVRFARVLSLVDSELQVP